MMYNNTFRVRNALEYLFLNLKSRTPYSMKENTEITKQMIASFLCLFQESKHISRVVKQIKLIIKVPIINSVFLSISTNLLIKLFI